MYMPRTERAALEDVMQAAENDLAAAHEEICKLQGLDPATHTWPEWSSPANTLRWFSAIREKFGLGAAQKHVPERPYLPKGWSLSVSDSDGRTWLCITNPNGASATLSCSSRSENGETIAAQILHRFGEEMHVRLPAAPKAEGE